MLLSRQEPFASPDQGQPDRPHFMLFSPWYFGHHATYLRHLIHYWSQQNLPGRLSIVVMPTFLEKHSDVVAFASEKSQTVRFIAIAEAEQVWLESARSTVANAMVQYKLIVRYAEQLQATQGLLTHFDSCQLPLVLGLKLPCPFSGIYFRPTFHYANFADYTPTWKERIQHLRERLFLSRLLAHPQFKTLFCLDPLAIDPINQWSHKQAKAAYLPDPVERSVNTNSDLGLLKQQLGIELDRKVFLVFGTLADARKGTRQLLEALNLLEPKLCRKVCILLVGEPTEGGQATIKEWMSSVDETLAVQIVTRFGYVAETEVSQYFCLADAVMAPYQKPAGMSGILLLAAVAQKPILSSSYGLIGELVRQYGLGVAVDTTVPSEIAKGLNQLLSQPFEKLCNRDRMRTLAEMNSTEQFASTIFQHLYEN